MSNIEESKEKIDVNLIDAFNIVMDLASQNVLEDEQVEEDEEVLGPERDKQEASIEKVREFFNFISKALCVEPRYKLDFEELVNNYHKITTIYLEPNKDDAINVVALTISDNSTNKTFKVYVEVSPVGKDNDDRFGPLDRITEALNIIF